MFKTGNEKQMPAVINGIFDKTLKRKEAEEREARADVVVKKPRVVVKDSKKKYAKKKTEGGQGKSRVDKGKNK